MSEKGAAPSRSYEDLVAGQQLYRVIEMCASPETLWAKICSGHWDWLGVQGDGDKVRYILGRPRLQRRRTYAALNVIQPGGTDRFKIEVRVPSSPSTVPSETWCADEPAATAEYALTLESLSGQAGSGLWEVRLVIDGKPVASELIVRALPNRL